MKILRSIILFVIASLLVAYLNQSRESDMKKVFIVKVSDSEKPVFPEACVVCGHRDGEQLTTLKVGDEAGRVDFYFYNFRRTRPDEFFLDIPAQVKCIKDVRNRYIKRLILIITVAVAVVMIGIMNKFSGFFCSMAFLVVVGILLGFEVRNPVPFEYKYHSHNYVLFFKDRYYAEEVALLNKATVTEGDYTDY